VFDRASVNVSQVHYADEPTRKLASATALSTIIHPAHRGRRRGTCT
jgi:coproporphyrinogen III oxidase